jgi:CRP-like cAMP-binding protein
MEFFAKVRELVDVSEEEEEFFRNSLTIKKIRAGEFLLRQGEVAKELFFIEKGLIRAFHVEKDKEINTYLGADGCYYTSLESFLNQKPSEEYIQTLEDSMVTSLRFTKMKELKETFPGFNKILNAFLEQGYLCVSNRLKTFQMRSAREKYESFLNYAEPKVIQRTPLLHIASYLGIAPESLSRVRRELVKS